jgi:hypothetical protein
LFLGGARGRGFGKVKVARVEPESGESLDDLGSRLDRFTREMRQALEAVRHPSAGFLFFALTLTSDLLLPPGAGMDWLRGEVARALELEEQSLRIEKAVVRTGFRGGFNEAIGVQKVLVPALAMGSAVVFSYLSDTGEVRARIVAAMQQLLRIGLGMRREDGFGLMSFCDAFHLERRTQG